MSRNPSKKKNNKPKKRTWAFYTIIISLIILAIPVVYLGYTGIASLMSRGEPIVGNRYNNDLDPAITNTDLDNVEKALSDFEDVKVSLKTSTLRVYLLNSSMTKDNLESTVNDAYERITAILSAESYFTAQGVKKQYDLEIHAFNNLEDDAYVYGVYLKNSNMVSPLLDVMSAPKSQDTVDYFYENDAVTQPETEEPIQEEAPSEEE